MKYFPTTMMLTMLPLNVVFANTSCLIDLDNNTHTCGSLSAVSFVSSPANSQAVAKITLDGAISSSGFKQATFEVFYGGEPTDWTVNIGDSSSNNGYGGDGSTQSNDSEMHIINSTLFVYGNDYIPPAATIDGMRKIHAVGNSVAQGDIIKLTVCNEYLAWDSPNVTDDLSSPYIYGLNGQPDSEGSVNYDIYAAFNRVIANSGRNGSGASSVRVHLSSKCGPEMGVELEQFMATTEPDKIRLNWATGTETNNAGFRLWRGIGDGNGGYTGITLLEELTGEQFGCMEGKLASNTSELISAVGDSTNGGCYSFLDTTISAGGTYYYLLEDVDMDGTQTLYCEDIQAVTAGQGLPQDIGSAVDYCKNACLAYNDESSTASFNDAEGTCVISPNL